jgi:hypothetical protein
MSNMLGVLHTEQECVERSEVALKRYRHIYLKVTGMELPEVIARKWWPYAFLNHDAAS